MPQQHNRSTIVSMAVVVAGLAVLLHEGVGHDLIAWLRGDVPTQLTSIPRTPESLPRPLTAEQDQLLQQQFLLRNDLVGNIFLLLRHTGMRVGRMCVDLLMTACARPVLTNGLLMFPSASSKPNAWSPSMPSSVTSYTACASSVLWIRCQEMDGSWPGRERKNLSSPGIASTSIWSATLSVFQ